ncbi:MAG TPA: nuclear transport factor 2 family protein [Alphaproteobacteria bacterium]
MDFVALTEQFCAAATAGTGADLAALFAEDGVYHDGFYGAFHGRAAIADMIDNHFRRDAEDFAWKMYDPALSDHVGYAHYVFAYTAKFNGAKGRRVVFEGIGRFRLAAGLIAAYDEIFDAGIAMVQLGFAAERIVKRAERAAGILRTQTELARFMMPAPDAGG